MPRRVRKTKRSQEIIVPWSAAEDQKVNNCRADEVFAEHGPKQRQLSFSVYISSSFEYVRQVRHEQRSASVVSVAPPPQSARHHESARRVIFAGGGAYAL